MGVHMELEDLETAFQTLSEPPIIANYFDTDTKEGMEVVNRLLYTKYAGDSLGCIPSCFCKHLSGEFYKGRTCPKCFDKVENPVNRDIQTKVWFETPQNIDAFINPVAFAILSKAMTDKGINCLLWLCDPKYVFPANKATSPMFRRLLMNNVHRGINFFFRNFDAIMEICFPIAKAGYNEKVYEIRKFVTEYRQQIFTKHIPMPSNVSFVIESNDTGQYTDTTMTMAINAMRIITSINSSAFRLRQHDVESRVTRANKELSDFYKLYTFKVLGRKKGIFRHHVFGGRSAFSARAVITSLSDAHHYQEVHLPWSLSVQLMAEHIKSKLLNEHKYTPKQIDTLLAKSVLNFDPLVSRIIAQLIEEAPFMGIPILLQRNPSLKRGSAQMFYVTKVKTDPRDYTISMSVLTLKAPNADFDGDELNIILILDRYMHDKLSRLQPHLGTLDLNRPKSISSNLSMPAPVLSTLCNWLNQPIVPDHLAQPWLAQ